MRTSLKVIASVIIAASSVFFVGNADAQAPNPENLAKMQALYDQAVISMDAGRYASACPKLEIVVQLIPQGVGAKLTLAQCYEGAGQLASAWQAFSIAEIAATEAKQTDRAKRARERKLALEPKLSKLTIIVPEAIKALPEISIRCDGKPLKQDNWSAPIPIDRGSHVIAVSALNKLEWVGVVQVESDGVEKSIEVAELMDTKISAGENKTAEHLDLDSELKLWESQQAIEAPVPKKELVREAKPIPIPIPQSAPPPQSRSVQWHVGAALAGAGFVGLGLGTIFGISAVVNNEDSLRDGHCAEICDKVGSDLRRQALSYATVSTALFGYGGAIMTASVIVLASDNSPTAPQAKVSLGVNGIGLHGVF